MAEMNEKINVLFESDILGKRILDTHEHRIVDLSSKLEGIEVSQSNEKSYNNS
jgi:hypothetical protein